MSVVALHWSRRRVGRTLGVLAATALTVLAFDSGAHATGLTTQLTTESFTAASTTDGNWIVPPAQTGYTNLACMTAGTDTAETPIPACSTTALDSVGAGALRLTNNAGNQVGSVYNTVSLPGSQGLDITFDSYQYDGSGADGIAFILAATDPADPHPPTVDGPFGGSLGYSAQSSPNAAAPGVSYGYLGFGLDVYGNFENAGFGGPECASTTQVPESVTVRGPGNDLHGYCIISTAPLGANGALDRTSAGARPTDPVPVEIAVNPGGVAATSASGLAVAAKSFAIRFTPLGGTAQTVTGALPTATTLDGLGFPADWYDPTTGVPYQLTFGWAASTGGSNEFHEINQLHTSSLNGQVPVYALSTGDNEGDHLLVGGTAELTVTPTVATAEGAEAAKLTVTTTLPTGITPGTATGTGYSCATAGQTVTCSYDPGGTPVAPGTSLPLTIPVTATASAASSSTVTAKVSSNDSLPATASSTLEVSSFTASASPASTTHGTAVTLSASLPAAATGDVDFTHGTTLLCTASAPSYSCSAPALLDVGSYPVTATLDDAAYGKLTAATSFDVGKAATTLTATASAASTPYGTADTLTAAGLPADATGTVTFTSRTDTLCTITLPATSCSTSSALTPATYAVTATYSGDNNYLGSPDTTSFDVTKATTAITATPTDATVAYKHTNTLTVGSVPAGATGTVTFTSGGTTLCTVTLPATSCSTSSALTPATYPVTATYSGDNNYLGSTDTTSFDVRKGATSALAASAAPATAPYGSSVTLGFSGLPADATGSVTFTSAATALCTVADVAAASSCSTPAGLAVASYPVTASYSGDANYQSSTAGTTFAIAKVTSPSFAAAVGERSLAYGTVETLSFSGLAVGSGGSVTFTSGGTTLCTVPDVTKAPSCQAAASLAAGGYDVTATYSGDAEHAAATADTAFTVTKAPVSTTAIARATSIAQGQSQTLSIAGMPADVSGTVTFSAGGTTLCTVRLPATSCTPPRLAAGTYHVVARYSGDENHAGTTASVSFTVTAAPRTSTTVSTPVGTTMTMTIHVSSGDDTVTISQRPAHGTVKIVTGSLVYTPASGFAGTDTVTMRIVHPDGSISYQTVLLRVSAVTGSQPSGSAGLADTGASVRRPLLLAGALLGSGAALLSVVRRPRSVWVGNHRHDRR